MKRNFSIGVKADLVVYNCASGEPAGTRLRDSALHMESKGPADNTAHRVIVRAQRSRAESRSYVAASLRSESE